MIIKVRKETPTDVEAIHEVTAAAFLHAQHTDHTEQYIVTALRDAGVLIVSLVAELGGKIIGHVAVSPVTVSDGSENWYGLGPISVLPDHQGHGVGSQLMQGALADLKGRGAVGCVVLGDPEYYRRFGFEVVEGLFFPGVPAEYFQALSFDGRFPEGMVAHHAAFSAQG